MTAGIGYSGIYASSPGGASTDRLDTGYVWGVVPSWLSASQIQISTGVCRSIDDSEDIRVAGVLTVDITATGANGRNIDTAEQADKWYEVNVIKNPTSGAVAGFLINQDDVGAFTWPAGYTVRRRVGWIRNNNTSDIREGYYSGNGFHRKFKYRVNISELTALLNGNAVVFTDIDISEWVPPTSRIVDINNNFAEGGGGFIYYIRPRGSTYATPVNRAYSVDYWTTTVFMSAETDNTQIIQYMLISALDALTIYCVGYDDEI
jgi:hypothetical protein